VGGLHEADAELVDLGDGRLLALKVDAVVEEVSVGLYRSPRTVGRIAAASSLSDLAAVGADVFGVLVCATLPRSGRDEAQTGVALGLRETLDPAGVFVLGGDTNDGDHLALAVCAAGLVPRNRLITRVGARPGDSVFASGPLGAGGALGASVMMGLGGVREEQYRPVARLREGRLLRGVASCCMDTSDGFVATADQLARINEVGFRIERSCAELLHPLATQLGAATGLPAFAFLASYHGEFELVFTVAPAKIASMEARARTLGWVPIPVGVVERECNVDRDVLPVLVFDLCFGQSAAAVEAPVHRLQAAIDVSLLEKLAQRAYFIRLVPVRHRRVRMIPVAEHAQALEVRLLAHDLLAGIGACEALRLLDRYVLAMRLLDLHLDGHPVAIPAGHVRRVVAGELFALDHDVLEDLVDGMTDVDVVVRVRRAVVQHETRPSGGSGADCLIDFLLLPLLDPERLALREIAAHRESRVRQVQRGTVVGRGVGLVHVGHGTANGVRWKAVVGIGLGGSRCGADEGRGARVKFGRA